MKALASFSAYIGKTFAVWVLLFAVLGFVLPDIFKLFGPYIVILLSIIMFGMGLTLSVDDFREVARRPADVAIGVVAHFVIMPLLAFLLTKIIPMPPEVAAGVILVGCCPGGTSSNVMTYRRRRSACCLYQCQHTGRTAGNTVSRLAAGLSVPAG